METTKTLRNPRLQLALILCRTADGDIVTKHRIVKGFCKVDPVIKNILKFYGVEGI